MHVSPPTKRRKPNPYVSLRGCVCVPEVIVARLSDKDTYLSWCPWELKQELLLRLPTLQAQRLANDFGYSVCSGEFWKRKARAKGYPCPSNITAEEYIKLVDTDEHVLAPRDITPNNKDCILDALVLKDLELFTYYAKYTRFQRSTHNATIEWFAHFTGPEFHQAWVEATEKSLGCNGTRYLHGGTRFVSLEAAALQRDVNKLMSLFNCKDVSIVPAVIAGGSLEILRYLLEGPLVSVLQPKILDWNPPVDPIDRMVSHWIACAKVYDHQHIIDYLRPLVRFGIVEEKFHVPRYYTVIKKHKGKYLWKRKS